MVLVDRQIVGAEQAVGEDEPGTVSLEKLTNRPTGRDRRLEHVERAHHVVAEDDVRRVVHRLRDGGGVDDDLTAARERMQRRRR